jgi:hypothetical protein
METLIKTHRFTRRRVALIAVAVVAGAAMVTPAVGQAATFLTKQRAHKLYLGNTRIVSTSTTLAPQTGAALTVSCPAGLQAVDGGFTGDTDTSGGFVDGFLPLESYPVTAGARSVGWTVEAFNSSSTNSSSVTVQAVCSK